MPEVARRALRAALQRAVHDQAGTDAGTDLDEQHVRHVGPGTAMLAERHQVGVLVDDDRARVVGSEEVGHAVAVPTGHDRRTDDAAFGEFDRPRHTDADALDVGARAFHFGKQLVEMRHDLAEHDGRSVGHRDAVALAGEDCPAHVAYSHLHGAGADRGEQHHAGVGIDLEGAGRAAAGRALGCGRRDVAVRDQRIKPLRYGRA